MNSFEKLDTCRTTRKIAAKSLAIVLQKVLFSAKEISEQEVRDLWIEELRNHKSIFPDGWYMPPPYGIGVLFGNSEDVSRVSPPTIRNEEFWPKDNVYLDKKDGLMFF